MNQLAIWLCVLCIPFTMSRLTTSGVQCQDESGNAVDWWFVYKMPNGFQYAYYDSHSTGGLSLASDTLDCTTTCALGSTLHQVYSAKSTIAHLQYNDQPVEGSSTSKGPSGGHVKGVLAADKTSGFWLIHSVPLFPDLGPATFTWTASTIYGQSFLCVSLTAAGVEDVSSQLQYIDPNIYSSSIPTNLQATYPEMTALYGGTRQTGSSVAKITSAGGTTFTHFAKDNTWGQDLYDDLVEPYFKTAFQWETWRRAPFLPSLCTPYQTLNVGSISLGDQQFYYTQDHSKWGVSLKGSWSCVGDINRMQSQRSRGGGTMCLPNANLWKALSGVVASSEPCGGKTKASAPELPEPEPEPVSDAEEHTPSSPHTPKPKPGSSVPKRGSHAKPKRIATGPAPRMHGATAKQGHPHMGKQGHPHMGKPHSNHGGGGIGGG